MALPQTQPTAQQGLPLDSLEIKNFRAFRHLQIPKLGRVNLITGKNNVGKTTLLEALWLYTERGAVPRVRQLLMERGELTEREERFASTASPFDETAGVSSLRFLFHGRPALKDTTQPFIIDPMDPKRDTLTWEIVRPEDETKTPTLEVRMIHDTGQGSFIMDLNGSAFKSVSNAFSNTRCLFLTADRNDPTQTGRLWDKVALTALEEEVVAALRLMRPDLERIGLRYEEGAQGRIPFVKVAEFREPIPLASLGGGMNRLFDIALALVNTGDGTLLVDEIEDGLHYSVLPDVWRLVFQMARRLNVQVFATTHSWDCIEAFQMAAAESPEDGVLVKLRQNSKGGVDAIVFDEEELAVITRDQIEVR